MAELTAQSSGQLGYLEWKQQKLSEAEKEASEVVHSTSHDANSDSLPNVFMKVLHGWKSMSVPMYPVHQISGLPLRGKSSK